MLVLGIETSCDETAAAVVRDGRKIISNVIASSLALHKRYGGVIPEIASRAHVESIGYVVAEAIDKARINKHQIGLIAATAHPGLPGSLLVGSSFAKALSFALKKPLVEVDHIKAHLYASFLETTQPRLPFVGLVVSGGHTELFYVKKNWCFTRLGSTLDDAAGEAFDKVARILNLGYPGGPIIDRLSRKAQNKTIRFGCANIPDSHNFSFSGIKTAVLYFTQDKKKMRGVQLSDIAYAFQKPVVEVLVEKAISACENKRVHTLVVGGGVAANSYLRKRLLEEAKKKRIGVFCPQLNLCMDNAAMVAGLGFHLYTRKRGGA
ncbi:tRNA (adenosine(37)-N6)-threonylcarbamoyltransferase complex transferase subunit TsaD [Candidatus Omnitrophota bacterium]